MLEGPRRAPHERPLLADRQLPTRPVPGAASVGLPQPVKLERYTPGAPVVSGAVLFGAAPGGRLGETGRAPSRARSGSTAAGEIRRARQGAGLRRHRDRRLDRAGRAAALLPPQREAGCSASGASSSSARLRPGRLRRARPPPSARWRASPARSARRSARGVDRAARLRRAGRRGPDRLHPALPALAALGLRLGPGDRDRRRPSPRPRRSTGRGRWTARWRSSPAPRAGSARRSPTTLRRDGAALVLLDVPSARGRPGARSPSELDGETIELDITAAEAPRADRRALSGRRRRRRPQRRRHPRPHDREDARGALDRADGDQPLQRGADQRRAARPQACCARTGASSASPRWRGSPATRARPTTRPRRRA